MSMRQLMLMRHAKSAPAKTAGPPGGRAWGQDAEQPDHARPLNAAGHRAASAMREALRDHGFIPDVVLVSSARRTMQTLEALAPWDDSPLIEPMDRLYLAGAPLILQIVRGVSETVRSVMVIGHNPGLHELATLLLGPTPQSGDAGLRRLMQEFPTGALAVFTVPQHWRELSEAGGCRLERFLCPSDLPGANH
jgi:phosphohistidine phosphatase